MGSFIGLHDYYNIHIVVDLSGIIPVGLTMRGYNLRLYI